MYSSSDSMSFGHSEHIPFVISNANRNTKTARNVNCNPMPVPVLRVVSKPGYFVAPHCPIRQPLGLIANLNNAVSFPHRFGRRERPSYYQDVDRSGNPPPPHLAMLNTMRSNSDPSRCQDHSKHIGGLGHSLSINGANTMISGLSSFSSLSASSNPSNSTSPNVHNSAHHVQPPPTISVSAHQSDSKNVLHQQHSQHSLGSHDSPSVSNTDTVGSVATNDQEGSSSLPIDLTRSNSHSLRSSMHSTVVNSVSNSHCSSPAATFKQSPNSLHNPVVNSVADLTIGRSKALSHGLKRRLHDHSGGSPRAKRPKLDHAVNGLNGVGRGMMNLLNLHNPANGMIPGLRSNAPDSSPLQDLQRSLLAGKQQQHQQHPQLRTCVTSNAPHFPNAPNGRMPNGPHGGAAGTNKGQRPVALTLQQLINYLGKSYQGIPGVPNAPNVHPNGHSNGHSNGPPNGHRPASTTTNTPSSSSSVRQTPQHPPRAAMVPPNHTTVPS